MDPSTAQKVFQTEKMISGNHVSFPTSYNRQGSQSGFRGCGANEAARRIYRRGVPFGSHPLKSRARTWQQNCGGKYEKHREQESNRRETAAQSLEPVCVCGSIRIGL